MDGNQTFTLRMPVMSVIAFREFDGRIALKLISSGKRGNEPPRINDVSIQLKKDLARKPSQLNIEFSRQGFRAKRQMQAGHAIIFHITPLPFNPTAKPVSVTLQISPSGRHGILSKGMVQHTEGRFEVYSGKELIARLNVLPYPNKFPNTNQPFPALPTTLREYSLSDRLPHEANVNVGDPVMFTASQEDAQKLYLIEFRPAE